MTPSWGLIDRRDHGPDGGPFGSVAPQFAQPEQEEHDPEGVDLPPDDAVEPEDRVHDRHEPAEQRESRPPAELQDHRPDEPADDEVGQDRRDLDQVADIAGRLADQAHEPQHVQVSGRVVVEEVAVVEPAQAVGGEVVRPEAEGVEVGLEPGAWEQLCDDEPEDESEREDDQDRACGSLRPGRPRRRSCAPLGPNGCGASHREWLLHERGRWIGA